MFVWVLFELHTNQQTSQLQKKKATWAWKTKKPTLHYSQMFFDLLWMNNKASQPRILLSDPFFGCSVELKTVLILSQHVPSPVPGGFQHAYCWNRSSMKTIRLLWELIQIVHVIPWTRFLLTQNMSAVETLKKNAVSCVSDKRLCGKQRKNWLFLLWNCSFDDLIIWRTVQKRSLFSSEQL